MAHPPIDLDLLKDMIAAVQQHGGISAAARALGLSRSTLNTRIDCAIAQGLVTREGLTPRPTPRPLPEAAPALEVGSTNAFDAEWRIFAKEIGMARDRYAGPSKRPCRVGRQKILVIPDLHAPFHERAMLAAMLERERDADHVVVMGDIGDGYAFSRFIKYESVPYEQELAAITLILESLSERFPTVTLIAGNHDHPRLEKQLRDRLSSDMIAAIQAMTGGTLDPVEALCQRRFPNVAFASHRVGRHRVKWMTQIGDAIFCHAEKFSKVPGSALRSIEEWFADNERQIELQPWRAVFQAHTHQLAVFPYRADKLLVETGCLATTPGYAVDARVGGRPQRRGYCTLDQIDGVTDFNSVRLVWLDADEAFRRSA